MKLIYKDYFKHNIMNVEFSELKGKTLLRIENNDNDELFFQRWQNLKLNN